MNDTSKVIITLDTVRASGNRESWFKTITGIIEGGTGAKGFAGEYLKAGQHRLPVGTILLHVRPLGSVKNGTHQADVLRVQPDGTLAEIASGLDWRKELPTIQDIAARALADVQPEEAAAPPDPVVVTPQPDNRAIVATLRLFQPCTAQGNDDSGQTLLAIITDENDEVRVIRECDWEKWENYATLHGLVLVRHPWVMVGTRDEIAADLTRQALSWLNNHGFIWTNDHGVRFLQPGAAEKLARLRNYLRVPLPRGSKHHLTAVCPVCGHEGVSNACNVLHMPGAVICSRCGWSAITDRVEKAELLARGGAVAIMRGVRVKGYLFA